MKRSLITFCRYGLRRYKVKRPFNNRISRIDPTSAFGRMKSLINLKKSIIPMAHSKQSCQQFIACFAHIRLN